jgi:hypothetical protein
VGLFLFGEMSKILRDDSKFGILISTIQINSGDTMAFKMTGSVREVARCIFRCQNRKGVPARKSRTGTAAGYNLYVEDFEASFGTYYWYLQMAWGVVQLQKDL